MIKDKVKNRLKEKIKDWVVKNPRRVYFTIEKENLKEVANVLYKEIKMRLCTITGIDNENNFELIYHFSFDKTGEIFNVRIFLKNKNNPEVDSLCDLFNASNWIEREIYEMLGINFKGHPNLEHLLLNKNWPKGKYPLRKDYTNE
ncbi:MAG: NADH-quinone oxidoreductase subunit C [Candidatus Omnitrophica bacterium]|nr:NADH-quinone oxidoreductase subunit C [Candidatus Omnitrophota bacterium]